MMYGSGVGVQGLGSRVEGCCVSGPYSDDWVHARECMVCGAGFRVYVCVSTFSCQMFRAGG